jgi:CheY-like chemotaxis protein
MCDVSESSTQGVLVVEDNPDLRRHLSTLLGQQGIHCILVKNEDEAFQQDLHVLSAIVADIDLSEAGGDPQGGILLAKGLAEKQIHIPIILVSCTPPEKINGSDRPMEGSQVYAILDRNSDSFREDLVKHLHEVLED